MTVTPSGMAKVQDAPSAEGDAEERRLIDRSAAGLHRVAANAVTDALRRRRPIVSLDGMEQPPASSDSDPQDISARHDLQRAVRDAIASLPSHYRDTIALQAFGELSYDEIAKTLDIPLGTVMSRLNGAKKLLRERLGTIAHPEEEANTA